MDKNIRRHSKKLCSPPKGILAADESTNTIKKRFTQLMLITLSQEDNTENYF